MSLSKPICLHIEPSVSNCHTIPHRSVEVVGARGGGCVLLGFGMGAYGYMDLEVKKRVQKEILESNNEYIQSKSIQMLGA